MGSEMCIRDRYWIADETCVLDCSKGERLLGWTPKDDDPSMLLLAYRDYKAGQSRDI